MSKHEIDKREKGEKKDRNDRRRPKKKLKFVENEINNN